MKRILSIALVGALALLGACGDDDTETGSASAPTETETTSEGGDEGAEGIEVTVTSEGIEVPPEFPGGAVEVTVDNQTGNEEIDVGFARVQEGTSEDAFRTAIEAAFAGESIDELIEAASGILAGTGSTTESVIIEPGNYFVFTDAGGGDEDSGASQLFLAAATVTEGASPELPETDGTITATDYTFAVDVQPGEAFTFQNDGAEQFHHALLFNFADIEQSVVEENIKAFLEAEGPEDAPEALAGIEEPFVGGSSVFSPGLGGTFKATLEAGNTYAVVCFISDRVGGPPHAFAYDMFEVFTVE